MVASKAETGIVQAIHYFTDQVTKLSAQIAALTSEVRRLHHSVDKATQDFNHPKEKKKPTMTDAETLAAFEAYQRGDNAS